MTVKLTKVSSAMPFPPPAGDDGPRLNSRGFNWEPVISIGLRARMVTMWTRSKKNHKPMTNQRRLWRTGGIVEPVMSTGTRARMATMPMSRKKHCKLTMDHRRLWRTECIVRESMKIGVYISDL
jgi:hypothetical protein